ncbi:MAG: hypothetical protein RIS35_3185 [Pseudomonadota bacterium]|jgi:vitamin B12 transporter
MSFQSRTAIALSAALACAFVSPVPAQDMPGVVVTATRSEAPLAEALADVTVIDAETIARAGAASLAELLRAQAGIEISQSGSEVGLSGIFIRGTKTNQTLVLVDGVRLENPTSGVSNLEYLPLSAIERIEVVRGPLSSLYGSGAVGGVIQVFTRQGTGAARPFASIGFGSQGTRKAQAGFSGSTGKDGDPGRTRFSIAMSAERTHGIEATRPVSRDYQEDRDGFHRRSATASLVHDFSRDWQAGAAFLVGGGRSRYDDAYSTPDTARFDFRTSTLSAHLRGRVAAGWQTELRVGETRIDYRYDAFGYAPRTGSLSTAWQNTVALPLGRALFGVEQLRQRIDGDGVTNGMFAYQRSDRRTDSAFAGYEANLDRHLVRLQLRTDRIETVGSEPSTTLAWGYRLGGGWQLRAAYAEAFRAPTFDDLYSPFGANPELRPERSRNTEVGLEYRRAQTLLKATAFSSRIRDAIELGADYIPRNLDSARVHGVSVEGRQRIGEFSVRAAVTLQDPRGERFDSATGDVVSGPLARRAKRFATAGIDWQPAAWRVGLEWLAQGGRVDSNGQSMAGYGIVALSATYPLSKGLDLFARLDNLGDKRYETAWGYGMPPRSVFVGLRYQGL